jgi:hypothetical protein
MFWEGRGFTGCGKNSMLHLILGGAALQRCDNWLVFSIGFSRCGQTATQKILFPRLFGRAAPSRKKCGL